MTCPAAPGACADPRGGYRFTIAAGEITQENGKLTGARPAGVLDARAEKGLV